MKSECGFTLTELIVVTALVVLATFAVVPGFVSMVSSANMTAVGTRGRDIYVAITGANTEREPLGLPPVWPADVGLYTNASPGDISGINFTNSTDFFWVLNDGANLGTEKWSPYIAGFDFSKLAGGGVLSHSGSKPLKPENNIWTVAKNVHEEIDDIVPVLYTRTVDATSLASKMAEDDFDKKIRFDPTWEHPYRDKGAVFIRKGGGMFKARAKYMVSRVLYNNQTFDANVDNQGETVTFPLKYLTPISTVIPCEKTYEEGIKDVRLIKVIGYNFKRSVKALKEYGIKVAAIASIFYLVIAVIYSIGVIVLKEYPRLSGFVIVVGLFHWISVTLYVCFVLSLLDVAYEQSFSSTLLIPLLLSLAVQSSGIGYVITKTKKTERARECCIKWLVSAPVFSCVSIVALIVISLFKM